MDGLSGHTGLMMQKLLISLFNPYFFIVLLSHINIIIQS